MREIPRIELGSFRCFIAQTENNAIIQNFLVSGSLEPLLKLYQVSIIVLMYVVGFEPTKVTQKILSLSHFPNLLHILVDNTTIYIVHIFFKPFHVRIVQAGCSFLTASRDISSVEIGIYL